MPRYVAFLRGVSPQNCSMSQLRACFEEAGFTNVTTLLTSGNVVFDSSARSESSLERKAEQAIEQSFGRVFHTMVRRTDHLHTLLASDPYAAHRIPRDAKRVVTFLRKASASKVKLPLTADGASVLGTAGREAFTAYIPSPKGPVFMKLIEKTFGSDVTTRTWDTVRKCADA